MLKIRPERTEDIASIYKVNEQAFGRKPEAEIVDKLRNRGVLTVSLVAELDGNIVGCIAFSPVTLNPDDPTFKAASLGPVSVVPDFQRKLIGSLLIKSGLKECQKLGYEVVVLCGHPQYYSRFGFVPARAKGLECEYEAPDDAWMVLELKDDALGGRQGTIIFPPEFKEGVDGAK